MDTERPFDPRLAIVSSVLGMLAIVALPLSAIVLPEISDDVGRVGASVLAFATPATFVAAGRLRGRAWMMSLGVTLGVVLLPVVVLGTFTGVALLSLFIGPVVAAVAVGLALQSMDTVAAAGFLGGGTIAVVGGFAAAGASATASAGVIAVASVAGLAVTASRLRTPAAA